MAIPQRSNEDEGVFLEGDDARAYFDAEVRELVGISGEEFLRRLDAGEWDDVIDDAGYEDHLYLASLSPLGR